MALVIAVPGINPGALISALGISSVAIGFAFKDILQNTLAGLLLLFRQPFEVGDEIEVSGHQGTVEAITIRETRLRTFHGTRVLIANSDVYSSAVEVQTAYDRRRHTLLVGIDYEADLAAARRIALSALATVDGVLAEPPPDGYYAEMNVSTVDLDLRFWTRPTQAEEVRVRDGAVEAVDVRPQRPRASASPPTWSRSSSGPAPARRSSASPRHATRDPRPSPNIHPVLGCCSPRPSPAAPSMRSVRAGSPRRPPGSERAGSRRKGATGYAIARADRDAALLREHRAAPQGARPSCVEAGPTDSGPTPR